MNTQYLPACLPFVFSLLFIFCSPSKPPSEDTKKWVLVWSDEFEGVALDTKKWTPMTRTSSYNNELQAYVDRNVYVDKGSLHLISKKEKYTAEDNFNPGKMITRDYTSGLVHTQGTFAFTFGRIEIRAKLPKTQGIWPAHWMLPEDDSWPPEIDIMELLGHQPNTVYFTNHWGTEKEPAMNTSGPIQGPDFSEDFHLFCCEWSRHQISWSIDDTLRFCSSQEIPYKPFFIILNTAVGGDWPKNPDTTTIFPQTHSIDYIRVYQKK